MGSGFRTFTAGEVLSASNVQNYLQDQVVMTFADSAARSSAIGTANFEEGMTSYLQDTKLVEVYNGTAWVGVAPTTSQGLTLINTTSFSGVSSASLPADTFTSTYTNYRIMFDISAFGTAGNISLRMRAAGADSSAASYSSGSYAVLSNATAAIWSGNLGQSFWTGPSCATGQTDSTSLVFDIMTPKEAVYTKYSGLFTSILDNSTNYRYHFSGGIFTAATSFDSMSFIFPGTTSGRYSVYAYNK